MRKIYEEFRTPHRPLKYSHEAERIQNKVFSISPKTLTRRAMTYRPITHIPPSLLRPTLIQPPPLMLDFPLATQTTTQTNPPTYRNTASSVCKCVWNGMSETESKLFFLVGVFFFFGMDWVLVIKGGGGGCGDVYVYIYIYIYGGLCTGASRVLC
jgi:hypothetical protein